MLGGSCASVRTLIIIRSSHAVLTACTAVCKMCSRVTCNRSTFWKMCGTLMKQLNIQDLAL